ncbi:TPA: hypothetical protein PEV06_000495 [Acinetobacter baumannii]|uniref:hypothetical protein n=1 Tax=Acinetobacter baumannii TaxID=470 RepID=UPI001FD6ED02|nr:hypothetical protein [Acinetobacter baumannii]MDC5063912.1 hypothetical protein [Acinetobacter baumannii]HCH8075527.1 hypothetical protein [Acinetobacter baumannii]HDF7033793.1 hypothetical protein [Acinetobacter baumannii]
MSKESDIAHHAAFILKETYLKTALYESVLFVEKGVLWRTSPNAKPTFVKKLIRDNLPDIKINRKGVFKLKKLCK